MREKVPIHDCGRRERKVQVAVHYPFPFIAFDCMYDPTTKSILWDPFLTCVFCLVFKKITLLGG